MRKRWRTSYAWALHAHVSPNLRHLSERARSGLELAEKLAEDALLRAERALRREPYPPPLTLEELAELEQISVTAVEARIRHARRELFGTLSDSTIYYRLKRKRKLNQKARLACAAHDCGRPLPVDATARRKYCGGRCRVSAHRERSRNVDGARAVAH